MKRVLILLTIMTILAGCWSTSDTSKNYIEQDNSYSIWNNYEWWLNTNSVSKNCHEPENPYSAWGHYEWFEWAREKWRSCGWNSSSFIEWCEEYYYQLENYESCLNN